MTKEPTTKGVETMTKEPKIAKGIRISPRLDRKIQRVQEHAKARTYNAAIEYLIEAGYRYYISQNPDAAPKSGRIPRLENLPPLK